MAGSVSFAGSPKVLSDFPLKMARQLECNASRVRTGCSINVTAIRFARRLRSGLTSTPKKIAAVRPYMLVSQQDVTRYGDGRSATQKRSSVTQKPPGNATLSVDDPDGWLAMQSRRGK